MNYADAKEFYEASDGVVHEVATLAPGLRCDGVSKYHTAYRAAWALRTSGKHLRFPAISRRRLPLAVNMRR